MGFLPRLLAMFVDAQKYLKVQDQDLNDAFDDNDSHHRGTSGDNDKYSKASFESFQLEPTTMDEGTGWWRRSSRVIPILVIIAIVVAVGVGLGLIFFLDVGGADADFEEVVGSGGGEDAAGETAADSEAIVAFMAEEAVRMVRHVRRRVVSY